MATVTPSTEEPTKTTPASAAKQAKTKAEAKPEIEHGEPAPADATVEDEVQEPREVRARKIIRRNVYWALGLGAIPIPFVDAAGVVVAQLKMVRELAALYEVPFSEPRAKAIVSSLVTTLGGQTLSYAIVASVVKVVPVVGYTLSIFALPIIGGALTLTLGNVFMMHFESGGTLLDFDAKKLREHFREEFEKNKLVVEKLRREDEAPKA